MKVHIAMTLDIDLEAWAAEYGTSTPAIARADVKRYVDHVVQTQLSDLGMLTTGDSDATG